MSEITDRVSTDRVIVASGLKKPISTGTSAAIGRCGVTAKRNGFAMTVRGAKEKCCERKVRKSVSNR